ncbi:MAG TPA: AI-2E family transporter [Mycobacteriales bacterium]|nr:AI-2E family transporter [Mycobacteriales bacterium]
MSDRDDRAGGMPLWLPRAIVLALVALTAFLALCWALNRLRGLLTLLLVSLFLTFAIEPAVNWLDRRGWRRGAATGLVFGVLMAVVVGFVGALGSVLVTEIRSIGDNIPTYADDLVAWVNHTFSTNLSTTGITRELTRPGGALSVLGSRLAHNALGYGVSLLGAVFGLFTILLFTFYLSADGPRVRHAVCSLLPPHRQREVQRAWDIAVDKTGGYLYSRALLAGVSAVAHYAAFRIIGLDFPLALAVWVGVVSQFIPTIGTYLAAVLPVLVGLATTPTDALWVLGFAAVYQQVENYLLQPRITARTLAMHPAVAFGSVIAGAALIGAPGALLALPVVATVQGFVGAYVHRYEVTGTTEAQWKHADDGTDDNGDDRGDDGGGPPGRRRTRGDDDS